MKKLFLLGITGLAFMQGAVAQDQPAKIDQNKLRFGAYVSPTISWMRPTTSKSDDGNYAVTNDGSKIGFTYGLMAEYDFASNYGLITGLQVNSTGGKIKAVAVDQTLAPSKVYNADFDYKLQYLEIPLALKLRTDPISGFRFFGQVGITAGFNIAKKATYKVTYTDENSVMQPEATGDKEKIKGALAIAPVMLQMNIGAGAEYPISDKLTAYIGLFFNNGFAPDATNPNKFDLDTYKGSFKDGNTRLNNFALRIGLFF